MNGNKARVRFGIGVVGMATAALMGTGLGRAPEASAQERFSVWDGVYLEEQATRGKDEYEYHCGTCHIHDLSGDSIKDVPALAGEDFLEEWAGKTVKELLDYMSTNMPRDSRGSLEAKMYADIASYVLKTNMFPAGTEALASDSPRLATTAIEREAKK
jgi:mono/diheme cytochrome c family protein